MMDEKAIKEFIEFYNVTDPYSKLSNIKIVSVGNGVSEAKMEVKEENLNFMGGIHGGALLTLADVAAGSSTSRNGRSCVTLNSTGSFLRPACPGDVYAYGKELGVKDNVATCEVVIKDSQGNIIYKGTNTMYLFDEYLKP